MGKKRFKQRAFGRAERRRARVEQLERASLLKPEDVDGVLVGSYLGISSYPDAGPEPSALTVGLAWRDLFELVADTCGGGEVLAPHEQQVMGALEREFERLYGAPVTTEVVADLEGAEEERRDDEHERA